ncbi:LysE family translocator [Pontivivens ytuae]|uniref:LysE family translocator n=1 Tax=Pontivivens ytuae TaxID=2789856 RepID=A0A7S9QC22_9RHOB|nr:LysE family translocator [Pontivivens ytuae]QPH52626.1 LysE family translocator [Pontivivens ytuae]
METAAILLTFALTHLAAVVSPGPSFIVVLRETVSGARRRGLLVAFGLGLGTLVWASGAWFGLAALFEVFPWMLNVLRWAGAAFLIWLAIQLWRHARAPAVVEATEAAETKGPWDAIRLGLLTQLANPKVAVFFGSIFVVILPADPSPMMLAAVFAIVFLNEFAWYGIVAAVMAARAMRRRYASAKPVIDRVSGTFLGALGLRLIADG